MRPPRKATNDPDSRIIEPGDMLIFINGVAPIYGTQSLFFLSKTLLARTKIPPPQFDTAANEPTQAVAMRRSRLIRQQSQSSAMQEAAHGQLNEL